MRERFGVLFPSLVKKLTFFFPSPFFLYSLSPSFLSLPLSLALYPTQKNDNTASLPP